MLRVTVIMVIHDINTGIVNENSWAIIFLIWLLLMFSYILVITPNGNISANIHAGG